jgi:energy-coupling factor transporter ATP-binding protein EcfA2
MSRSALVGRPTYNASSSPAPWRRRPKVLLLDEPTTGIVRLGQQQFLESITALKQRLGLTVVFVSHDLRAVSAISDRIACLNLTLHYTTCPEHLPADLVYECFPATWRPWPLGGSCGNPEHHHTHVKPAETMSSARAYEEAGR